mmetsp:Transcript_4994/g.7741  ORF Transcript_4994/g.7741 Transcript_4994/m.7741 type:complete len:311 (-) Transcript_4994:108-1040(-)|eukprot:CAMPEP_0184662306 /NCGR_PEP_ID=MMETSP0308-20130426/42533_1 /TAXON_ID=38269 /ORGANISM="Gloeochaete witrockiana, Strain SAG 46.84" /LENGTH=310 /DNA_ID=CAMNT_0027104211 /DNA_START=51 /DNA_END=983 /DNA_ORIENTATION=+
MDPIGATLACLRAAAILADTLKQIQDRKAYCAGFLQTTQSFQIILEQIRKSSFDSPELLACVQKVEVQLQNATQEIKSRAFSLLGSIGMQGRIRDYDATLRSELHTLQILVNIIVQGRGRNVTKDWTSDPGSKQFWIDRFGVESSYVTWGDFFSYVLEYHPRLAISESLLRCLLDSDGSGTVHAVDFRRFAKFFGGFEGCFHRAAALCYFHGNISSEEAKKLLRDTQPGTYLLRFSKSVRQVVATYRAPDEHHSILHQEISKFEQIATLHSRILQHGVLSAYDRMRNEASEVAEAPLEFSAVNLCMHVGG